MTATPGTSRTPLRIRLLPLVPFAGLLLAWALAGWLLRPSPATLPQVSAVAETLAELAASGELWEHVAASMGRWSLAIVAGVLTGVGLGLAAGLNRTVGAMVEPLATFFTAISGIVWLPLAIVWFGIGTETVVFIIWNSVFFLVFANTVLGVRSVPPVYDDAVRTLGGTQRHVVIQVVLPGALPYIVSGLRSGFGFAWRALIAAEIIGATAGLGAMIYRAAEFLRSDVIVAGNIVIGLLGLAIDLLVLVPLERRTVRRWGLVTEGGRA
ncbi:MAG: ABC transporter permease subunit [Streptosporangiales bacterium]|nr:ABC transporter permease subunit [Streptosporangiales bacterium]